MVFLCEFARDCFTFDGEHCEFDPSTCYAYRRKMIAEGEISQEEVDRLLARLQKRC